MKYNTRDIGMTEEFNEETGKWEYGDILLGPPSLDYSFEPIPETIDLQTKNAYENLRQTIMFRFLTQSGDYLLDRGLGHRLNSILGRRMSKELIEDGKALIASTLIYDDFLSIDDIDIVGIPIETNKILYTIGINVYEPQIFKFNLLYDGEEGDWSIV